MNPAHLVTSRNPQIGIFRFRANALHLSSAKTINDSLIINMGCGGTVNPSEETEENHQHCPLGGARHLEVSTQRTVHPMHWPCTTDQPRALHLPEAPLRQRAIGGDMVTKRKPSTGMSLLCLSDRKPSQRQVAFLPVASAEKIRLSRRTPPANQTPRCATVAIECPSQGSRTRPAPASPLAFSIPYFTDLLPPHLLLAMVEHTSLTSKSFTSWKWRNRLLLACCCRHLLPQLQSFCKLHASSPHTLARTTPQPQQLPRSDPHSYCFSEKRCFTPRWRNSHRTTFSAATLKLLYQEPA